MNLNNHLPQTGMDGGYLFIWNKSLASDTVDLRGSVNPATVLDTLLLGDTNFFPAFNHYGDFYAFQSDGPENPTTLKRWERSGFDLVPTQIGVTDDYAPGAETIAGPRNVQNRGWVSSDGAVVGWVQISTDRGLSHAVDIIRAYSTVDGTLLWTWDAITAGLLVPAETLVILSPTRFFCADVTTDNMNLMDDTGAILSTFPDYATYAEDGHFVPTGIDGVGWCKSVINPDDSVDIIFNQIETVTGTLALARATALVNTDWVGPHLNGGPTPIPQGYKDIATAMSVGSWADQMVVAPNINKSDFPTEEITYYWIDPSAGSYETSDPVVVPGDGPFRLFPAGAYNTFVAEFDSPNALHLLIKQPVGPNYPRVPFAPENAATGLRTLRELSNKDWHIWFTVDGTPYGADTLASGALNQYYLGYDASQFEYDYLKRMQYLLFSAATDTWRTDLADADVIADLGAPTYSAGPWQSIYAISSAASTRTDPVHPLEFDRLTYDVRSRSVAGRTLLAIIIDGSRSYEAYSGFDAWDLDDLQVPGIITAAKNINDRILSMGIDVDLLVIRCSDYDTQVATNVMDFDGTTIAVGGDGHRYGGDEGDWNIDPAPTATVIPAKIIYETSSTTLDVAALKTAWFANPTELDQETWNDTAETMLEGIRYAIGYGTADGDYTTKSMIVATDNVMKFPVDQYFDGYPWPDLPIVTDSFGPVDIEMEIGGTLWINPQRDVSTEPIDVDVTLSALLIAMYQVTIVGDM